MSALHESVIAVYPGISAEYNDITAEQKVFHHHDSPDLMEINHCHYGRVGWELNDGTSIYMGEGDVTLHSAALCSNSTMYFPMGVYQGITLNIDFAVVRRKAPEPLRGAALDYDKIISRCCKTDRSVIYSSDEHMQQIFAPLYHLPEAMRLPYLRVKVCELLLFLNLETLETRELPSYSTEVTETIRRLHDFLTADLAARCTIEELSKRFAINTSTLKEVFKAMYGMPVAAYMKEYRIRHAAKLLRHTGDSIAEISAAVGYETQSKFTKAFREVFGVTPSAYRRQG